MVAFLRRARPDAEISCICSNPTAVEELHGVRAVNVGCPGFSNEVLRIFDQAFLGMPRRVFNWIQAIERARRIDVLLIPGTGMLDDFREGPMGWPYVLFRWCLSAKLCGVKIAFVSVGAGPIRNPISRILMKAAARMAHYRSYRDNISKTFMQSLGLDVVNDPVYPDIAFKLGPRDCLNRPRFRDRTAVVGLGVMTYHGWLKDDPRGPEIYRTYLAKLAQFTRWLLDRGYNVLLLTGDTRDRRAVEDLLTLVAATADPFRADRLSAAAKASSLHDVFRQIASTDVVVATRYHNVVCALKLGKPTLSLGYARKNDTLLEQMGLSGFCQSVETFDVALLIEQFSALLAHRGQHEARIRRVVSEYLSRLEQQDEILTASLL